ncbi:IDEAL domain-containing protein [Priestia filamentosa]|uniref:IDEAL domain-containing protein n=1 Tax=Priestia filamentosa TaxID=1402861 RepID=UPI00397C2019
MKDNAVNPSQFPKVNVTDSLIAEMVLDQALNAFREQQIQKEIDQSLENQNKEEFLRLTEELKNLSAV